MPLDGSASEIYKAVKVFSEHKTVTNAFIAFLASVVGTLIFAAGNSFMRARFRWYEYPIFAFVMYVIGLLILSYMDAY